MTEYITKEQALEAVKGKMWPGEIEAAIKAVPPADVVEVTRCKDCVHKQVDEIIFALSSNPETALFCKHHGGVISETFYCGFGKRMDGD